MKNSDHITVGPAIILSSDVKQYGDEMQKLLNEFPDLDEDQADELKAAAKNRTITSCLVLIPLSNQSQFSFIDRSALHKLNSRFSLSESQKLNWEVFFLRVLDASRLYDYFWENISCTGFYKHV